MSDPTLSATPESPEPSDLSGDEYDDECYCGGAGCIECDPDRHSFDSIKWTADGTETLLEAAESLEAHAAFLRKAHEQGWILDEPVDNGHLHLSLPADRPVPSAEAPAKG